MVSIYRPFSEDMSKTKRKEWHSTDEHIKACTVMVSSRPWSIS